VKRFAIERDAALKFSGPTTVWVNGDVDIEGVLLGATTSPPLVKLRITRGGTSVNLAPQDDLYADIYAPLSDAKIAGTADIFGALLAKSVDLNSRGNFHFDESLGVSGPWARVELIHAD
jgi:hypothetical protein